MVAKPILQALVLADHVYTDVQTGKKIIAGTFSRLWTPDFPAKFGRPTYAFVCLTGLQGDLQIHLRYVDLSASANEVLMETQPIGVKSQDPLATLELVVEVPPFPMPHEGTYAFELHAGGEMLGVVRVQAKRLERGDQ